MRCDEVRPLLSAGLDGELEPGAAVKVQVHLAGCGLCAAEREALSATVRLLRAVPEVDPPAELRRRIGVALLETERRAERRWFGLPWLARPQAAGWAWGVALGTMAATVGLLATRGPATNRPVAAVPSVPGVTVPAPQPKVTPPIRRDAEREIAAAAEKKPDLPLATPQKAPPAGQALVELAVAPRPKPAVKPAETEPVRVARPPAAPRRQEPGTRRLAPPSPSPRSVPAAAPGSAPGSGRLESTSRDMPLVARSAPEPPVLPESDPPGDENRSGTDGMTQMASGMTEPSAPAAAADDLVELRRRLLDRPLHVPELGELRPTSSSRAGRDGWIRF